MEKLNLFKIFVRSYLLCYIQAYCVVFAHGEQFTLSNSIWQINIFPNTLHAIATLASGDKITISQPQFSMQIEKVTVTNNFAQWTDSATQTNIYVELKDNQLIWKWTPIAETEVTFPVIKSDDTLKSYLIPLKEGIRIQPSDPVWQDALANEEKLEMTESWSMPAFLVEYEPNSLSILFAENPFNNHITFNTTGQIDLAITHEVTPLSIESYEVQMYLEPPKQWLAASKRYKTWLEAKGEFVPLKDKISNVSNGESIIGASHVYVWGSYLLGINDVHDWSGLVGFLSNSSGWSHLNVNDLGVSKNQPLSRYEKLTILESLEKALCVRSPGKTVADYKTRRQIVEMELGSYLRHPIFWGDGLSRDLVEKIKKGGIDRALILTPGPGTAYYHPEAVSLGRRYGYLMGSYDSYNTAIPPGYNDDWDSAEMGQEALEMGIITKNGSSQSGFGGHGVYVNMGAIRPFLERRVVEIHKANAYNTWFLDVDASGLLFEDYDPSKVTSKRQDLHNRMDNMAWVGNSLDVLIGSEDGVAMASRPICYGHGMQSMGFGWDDPAMRSDTSSPYFVGTYYPVYNPSIQFKSVPVQEKYKQIYFNPKTRVPLFQAVMHNSVISTAHWNQDFLKFENVRVFNELLQQLYNVAPVLNLSQLSASKRTPYLKRIHDFFTQVHKYLAHESLDTFRWLDNDGLVQETGFSDGSQIVANFGNETFVNSEDGTVIFGNSVIAYLQNGQFLVYTASLEKLW